jgi:hypothetical protein
MKPIFKHRHECANCKKSYRCDRVTWECAIIKGGVCDECMRIV